MSDDWKSGLITTFGFAFVIFVSAAVGLVVWFFMTGVSSGNRFGPGEFVTFDSSSDLRQDAFFEQGPQWPGSVIHLHRRDDGYLLERHWLAWHEVAIPVSEDFDFDTGSYRYGTGEHLQRRIGDAVALLITLGILVILWRLSGRHRLSRGSDR